MQNGTVYLVTRNGLGEGPDDLRRALAVNFLGLLSASPEPPAAILFYGEGVRLACDGSPVLESLRALVGKGVRLVLCRTCLDFLGLLEKVAIGSVGKMTDVVVAVEAAAKVVTI